MERLEQSGALRQIADRAARGHHQCAPALLRDRPFRTPFAEQGGELPELGEREVRAPQHHHVEGAPVVGRQLPPRRPQLREADVEDRGGFPAAERVREGGRLRGHSGDVEERDRAGRRRRGPERLELVLLRKDGEPGDRHRVVLGEGTQQVAEHRIEVVSRRQFLGNLPEAQDAGGQAVLVEVEAHRGRPAGDRAADVQEVRVALGARPDDRVREGDRVRLAPRDLLPEPGRLPALVGGAGPGRNRPHRVVGPHLAGGLLRPLRRNRPFLPVELVQSADVERRGDPHPRAEAGEALGELEAGVPDVDRAVDVRGLDVQHRAGAADLRHARQDAHRQLRRFALLAGEERPVERAEPDGARLPGSHHGLGSAGFSVNRAWRPRSRASRRTG